MGFIMPDRTQEIAALRDALNAGVKRVKTPQTETEFADVEDIRRRLRELEYEHTGQEARPVVVSVGLGGF